MNCRYCQVPLGPGAAFCERCGQPTGAPVPGSEPWPSRDLAPRYDAPGYHPGPAADGGGLGVLGGCGVAGCLGVAFAAVVGVGLLALIAIAGSSSSPGTTRDRAPETGTESGQGSAREVRSSGALRELVTENVGSYRLVGSGDITNPAEVFQDGVVDSLGAVYRAPDKSEVKVFLFVCSSEELAKDKVDRIYQTLRGTLQARERLERGTVTGKANQVLGKAVVYTGSSRQGVTWSNGKLVAQTVGAPPHAFDFQKATTY